MIDHLYFIHQRNLPVLLGDVGATERIISCFVCIVALAEAVTAVEASQ